MTLFRILYFLWLILFIHTCIAATPKIIFDDKSEYPVQFSEWDTPVMSQDNRFIVPVPHIMDAPPLLYPEGPDKGKPVRNWEGKPIEGNGIVFWNGADAKWQAARANGKEVIIMNGVDSKRKARKLQKLYDRHMGNPVPHDSLTNFLDEAGKLGFMDRYNSDNEYIQKNMIQQSGNLYKRNGAICKAAYFPGCGNFQGPGADTQRFENGAVIVDSGNGQPRLVQPDIFEHSYRKAGSEEKIKIGELNQPLNPRVGTPFARKMLARLSGRKRNGAFSPKNEDEGSGVDLNRGSFRIKPINEEDSQIAVPAMRTPQEKKRWWSKVMSKQRNGHYNVVTGGSRPRTLFAGKTQNSKGAFLRNIVKHPNRMRRK